jgi:hypothetical protein
MPAYKDEKTGKWYASFYFTNWKGEKEKKMKRGFAMKREALEWEREFLQQRNADLTMTFEAFVKVYMDDMKNRIREHTWQTKISIIESKLLPYFRAKKMCDIAPKDIIQWQNEMMDYRKTRDTYKQYISLPPKKREDFFEAHRADITLHQVKFRSYYRYDNPANPETHR